MNQKAQCVMWYHEANLHITVQQRFINKYGREPPYVKSIKDLYVKFKESGGFGDLRRTGKPTQLV